MGLAAPVVADLWTRERDQVLRRLQLSFVKFAAGTSLMKSKIHAQTIGSLARYGGIVQRLYFRGDAAFTYPV